MNFKGSKEHYHLKKWLSGRILIGTWLLAMIVLVYAYQGVLMSILSVPKLKPTVNTLEELVEQHKLRLTIERSSTLTQLFLVYGLGNCIIITLLRKIKFLGFLGGEFGNL